MIRIVRKVLPVMVLMIGWLVIVGLGTLNGWWHQSIAPQGHLDEFVHASESRAQSQFVGNIAMALIENGRVYSEYFHSLDASVDGNSVFQVASLSKYITAWGVMKMVEDGKLDLDTPVHKYLTRWQLPPSQFDNDGVTVRRLLSHTAGLTDGLGYGGFNPGEQVQSLEASLTHAVDASPGADGRVAVNIAPGTEWKYSGGGYTLIQLIIEEVTGQSFEEYMQMVIFKPIGMNSTTYIHDKVSPHQLAISYNNDSTEAIWYRFTSLAATSLYTSLNDLKQFAQAHFPDRYRETAVLKAETIELMRYPHAYSMGAAIWGLGSMLFAPNKQEDFIIGHDGKNEPAINTAFRLNPFTGNGIIILETGSPLLATEIASEWVFWETGNVDLLMFMSSMDESVILIILGWVVIIIFLLLLKYALEPRYTSTKSGVFG